MRKKAILKWFCLFILALLFNTSIVLSKFSDDSSNVIKNGKMTKVNELENKDRQILERYHKCFRKMKNLEKQGVSPIHAHLIVDKKMIFVNCSITIERNITIYS